MKATFHVPITAPKGQAQGAFDTANSFFEGALRCATPVENPSERGKITCPASPTIACIAFAAELYLKSLVIAATGKSKDVHRLDKLYNSLSANLQKQIRKACCQETALKTLEFRDKLNSISNSFVEWRYSYEGTGNIEPYILFGLSRALYKICRAEFPEWEVDEYLDSRITGPVDSHVLAIVNAGGGRMVRVVEAPNKQER